MWNVLFLVFSVAAATVSAEQDCRIKISADDKFAKVYFEYFHWTRPKHNLGSSLQYIKHGSYINLSCGSGFVLDDLIGKSYTFQCTNGKFNKTIDFEDLLCRSTAHNNTEVRQISPVQFGSKIFKCDEKGWQAFQVKTRKEDGSARHLYTVCFDGNVRGTKFVFQPRRKVAPGLQIFRTDIWSLDYFGNGAYEKVRLSEGYIAKIQKDRLTKAFPDRYNSQKPYPYTFNRGHLAPRADFLDDDDKDASCEYLNIAPQWQDFNSNSWSLVEREVRNLVKNNPMQWEIYTGTYGSIPTSKGPLFVSPLYDKNGKFVKSYIPVPKLYWKLVYNVQDKSKSVVHIGINNPELRSPKEFTDKYVICKPIPDKNGNKFRGSEFKGFIYNCKLEDFLEKLRIDEKIVK